MTDQLDAVRAELAADVAWLARTGAIEPTTADEVRSVLGEYVADHSLAERTATLGRQYLVGQLVFELLVERGVALAHDIECIYGYESYGELLEEYAAITGGVLDGLGYQVHGDWSVGEDARVVVELDGEHVENELSYAGDWMDVDGFLRLLNRLIRDATDEPRRFDLFDVDTGQVANVVFARPEEAEALQTYFEEALEAREAHRED